MLTACTFTYISFYIAEKVDKKKVLQCWTVITKITAFPCHQHGHLFTLH